MTSANDWSECSHYYADPSGGFGWPSCVKYGKPAPSDPVHAGGLRACCRTREAEDHMPTCASMDARVKRGQPALGPIT